MVFPESFCSNPQSLVIENILQDKHTRMTLQNYSSQYTHTSEPAKFLQSLHLHFSGN